jgi:hypothetical protein
MIASPVGIVTANRHRTSVVRIDDLTHTRAGAATRLVGREIECRSLDALLASVRAAQSQVLVLRGEAGIGKSAVLRYLESTATDFTVVRATGVESEMAFPFAGLHQLCVSTLDRISQLPEPQRAAASIAFGVENGTPPDRLMIGLAMLSLLSSESEIRPLICIVDDAQWLDEESLLTLAFVARRLLADRIGMVFATREPSLHLTGFSELRVQGLNIADSRTLLHAVLHVSLDERVRDRIIAETRGNPLALTELPRGMTPAELAGGFGASVGVPMTGHIEQRFHDRVAELSEATQRFLIVAAADPTGDPVLVWRAAAALGVGPTDADPAVEAGLVDIGGAVFFPHPLMRSAVYESASRSERQAAHQALADATDPNVDSVRRAWHRALGSPGPDEGIAVELERAAELARGRGGFAVAAALLERSVALTSDPAHRGPRMLTASADHMSAAEYEAAARLLAAAEASPLDEVGRAQLDMLHGRYASAGGDARSAPVLLYRAAQHLEPLDASAALVTYLHALGSMALAGSYARDVDAGDIARAIRACPRADTLTTMEVLIRALADFAIDGPTLASPRLREALDRAAADPSSVDPLFGLSYVGGVAGVLMDFDSLQRFTHAHATATRDLGALAMLPWALNAVALCSALAGELDRAASIVAEANEIVNATGGNIGMAWSRAILEGWRGESDSLALLQDIAEVGRTAGNAQTVKHALWGTAILHNGFGRYTEALAAGSEALTHPIEADWGVHRFFHEHIEAAVRSGEAKVGTATLEKLSAFAEPSA